ncbi:hypothetical protein C8R46DRAFT_1033901 [Mycena filopes]|nr:hypothetical protein C8R46DRAFT_1033901 [Mycena filopes]
MESEPASTLVQSSSSPGPASDAAAYTVSDWERINYYYGISGDPPELVYRSDLLSNPFPIPTDASAHPSTHKTMHGVSGTPLTAVWESLAPQVLAVLKTREIRYSSMNAIRFRTHDDVGYALDIRGPVVIWITTPPGETSAKKAYEASLEILALLEANEIEGVVVEWTEGVVTRL